MNRLIRNMRAPLVALAVGLSIACVSLAQRPRKTTPHPILGAPPKPVSPKLSLPDVGDVDLPDGVLDSKLPKEGSSPDRDKGAKRTEFRPVTDWPHRINLLIRQSQAAVAFSNIFDAGEELSDKERTELAHFALNELAGRAEITKAPAVSLRETQGARAKAALLRDPALDQALTAVEDRLAYVLVYLDLQAIKDHLENNQWGPAANKAQVRLLQPGISDEIKKLLEEVARVGRHLQGLEQVQAALRTVDRSQPADTAEALSRLHAELFSAPLEKALRRFRASVDVRAAAELPWQRRPSVAALRQSLIDLELDPELSSRIGQDLSAKLFLEGYAQEAREMLPADGSPEYARALLRDLGAVVSGKGAVETPEVIHVLSASEWNIAGRPPSGIRSMIPPAERGKWRPVSRPATATKRAPAEEIARHEARLREEVRTSVADEKDAALDSAAEALAHVRAHYQERKRLEEEDQKAFAELESLAQRTLGPADRFVVRYLRRQGKKYSEISAALGPQSAVVEPAAFPSSSSAEMRMITAEQQALYAAQMVLACALDRPMIVVASEFGMWAWFVESFATEP
jgi:hypothetical protein